jgi:hypothetical protein
MRRMSELQGPVAVVAVVLAVGGVFKLRDPAPTVAMLRSIGLPAPPVAVRAVGVVEVSVGVGATLLGGPVLTGALAVLYAVFAAVTARLVRLGDRAADCGCFGRLSSAAGPGHVVANAAAAAVALAGAVTGTPGYLALRPGLVAAGIPQAALIALGAWLFTMVLTVLPDTLAAARRHPRAATTREFEVTSPLP